jgi:hypothetical protein
MGTPTSAPTGGGIIAARFHATGTLILLTVLNLEVPAFAWMAGLGYSIAQHSSRGIAITGIFTAVTLPMGTLGVVWMLRPTKLSRERLLVPRGLRRHKVVPLAEVEAVGMIYVRRSKSAGWDPYVWLRDGSRVRIPGQRFAGQSVYRSAAKTDAHPPSWQKIADSSAGRMCQAIRTAALGVQREGGALEGEHAGFWPASDAGTGFARAYWSADPAVGITLSPARALSP